MGRRTYDVFVSYNSKDEGVASNLARRLKKVGLKVWLAAWTIDGGDDFVEAIEAGLEKSRSVAVLVGAGGFGPWQGREIVRALAHRRLRVIPVLLTSPRRGSRTPLALAGLSRIDLTKGLDDKKGIGALVKAIKAKPGKRAAPLEQVDADAPKAAAPDRSIVVRGNGNQVATNGGIVAGNVTGGIIVTGGGVLPTAASAPISACAAGVQIRALPGRCHWYTQINAARRGHFDPA